MPAAIRVRPEGKLWPPYPQTFLRTSTAILAGIGIPSRSMLSKLGDWVSIGDFGGVGDGVTNNHDALRNAFNTFTTSGNLGSILFFPPGKYIFNSTVTATYTSAICAITIMGCGPDNTVLCWTSGGMIFNFTAIGNSCHLRDFSLTTQQQGVSTGVALNLSTNQNPATTALTTFYRMVIRGDDAYGGTDYWSTCISIQNVSNIQFEGMSFFGSAAQYSSSPGSAGTGVNFAGTGGAPASFSVQCNFGKSAFNYFTNGVFFGTFVQGISFDCCNFTNVANGINIGASQSFDSLLSVVNCQFAGTTAANANGIITSSLCDPTQIVNNTFLLGATGATAINLPQWTDFEIVGNVINNTTGSGATGQTGINVGAYSSSPGAIIAHNIIDGLNGTGSVGINLQNAANNVIVNGNHFRFNTTNISLGAGTGHIVTNNKGYNPVGGSAITVTASPFTYTAGSSPETVGIFGGTVSSVTQGGTQLANATGVTMQLDPGQSVIVTYSVAPTMNKFIH